MRSWSAKALRSSLICACKLFSSTIRSGQTRLISSSLLTRAPLASISTTSTSNARPPSSMGRPSARTSRRCGKILKRPNSKLAGASDTGSIDGDCTRRFPANSDLFSTKRHSNSDRCLRPAKETCWISGTFGRSERPGHRHQQQSRKRIVVAPFRGYRELADLSSDPGAVAFELFQKALCDFQIRRLEALGEAPIDRRDQLVRLFAAALVAPHPRETDGGA